MASELAKQGYQSSVTRVAGGWKVIVSAGNNAIWVGEYSKTGAVIVFDPNVKVEGISITYGYVVGENTMRQFDKSAMKLVIRSPETYRGDALIKYQFWKRNQYRLFLEKERAYIENMKTAELRTLHRVTHCKCGAPLDSFFHSKCKDCGWLICGCGKCGCCLS